MKKTKYTLTLEGKDALASSIEIIKLIRLKIPKRTGLASAAHAWIARPTVLYQGVSKRRATELQKKFNAIGASVSLKEQD